MLTFTVIAFILFSLFALYLRRTSLEKEDILDALAMTAGILLCVGFVIYTLPDRQPARAWPVTIMSYAERQSNPIPPSPKKSGIPDGPSHRLSDPAKDVQGLIKWTSIKKGTFDISEAWVGREDDTITRYNFHGRVSNRSDKIINGLEIEVIIRDCGRSGGVRKNCPIVGAPIRETTIGRVVQSYASYEYSIRLPFFGPSNNYEFEVRPTRVAMWQGPPTSSDYVFPDASEAKGYYEFSVDKTITCGSPDDTLIPSLIDDQQSGEILQANIAQKRSC